MPRPERRDPREPRQLGEPRDSRGPASEAELQAVFQELILDHYRRPRNKGVLPDPDASVVLANPLCGDEIELTLAFDGDTVRAAKFAGRGCSISQASASMMTEAVRGKRTAAVTDLGARVARMLLGDAEAAADPELGELRALSGVARFPARRKCVMLPWEAMERGMKG